MSGDRFLDVARNVNNNVVADRKWSPSVHTKIYIPPIGNVLGAAPETGRRTTATAISRSGSDSSDGCTGHGRGRLPASRNGSYRRPLSPATSPSLRSLHKMPSPLPSWSADAVSVRSLASIGMGSTDGRKLTIAKVPTSPAELLNLASPQSFVDRDDGDFTECSSCSRSLARSLSDFRSRTRTHYWRNKLQFILAFLGCSVGLSNMWRFPYHCHKSGGGIFLIPYFLVMIFCGIPLLYLELALGQFTKRGPIGAISKLCPIMKGVGLSSVVTSFFVSVYYNAIIAYTLYYFFSSVQEQPPWTHCNNKWNTDSCWTSDGGNSTRPSNARSPAEEFYNLKMLQISKGPDTLGHVRWELAACMLVVCTVVYFKLWKNTESSGRVLHLTAILPFVALAALLVQSLTLDGADIGLDYFLFKLRWELLLDSKIWVNAVGQNLSSIGVAFGLVISFASYNRYNNNILVDTMTISLVNGASSFAVGLFTFATLGNMAKEYGKSVEDVMPNEPGIVFILFTRVLSGMPYSNYLSMLLFFMMFCLAVNSEFAIVEVVVTSVQDGFPRAVKRYLICHELLVLAVCVASFLLGLLLVTQLVVLLSIPMLVHFAKFLMRFIGYGRTRLAVPLSVLVRSQGGVYLFQTIDHYACTWSAIHTALLETVAVSWTYGASRLAADIERIAGAGPPRLVVVGWYATVPAVLTSVWAFGWADYGPPAYPAGARNLPGWAHAAGWSVVAVSTACVPVAAVCTLLRSEGTTFRQKLNTSMKPRSNYLGELPVASKDNLKEMTTLIECQAPEIPPIIVFPDTVDNIKCNNNL